MRLPRNPTARLLAVADIIEQHPERHDQNDWRTDVDEDEHVFHLVGKPIDCKTKACVAGWGVAQTPLSQRDALGITYKTEWQEAACRVFGLRAVDGVDGTDCWYDELFDTHIRRRDLIRRLRRLAEIPTRQRTYTEAVKRGIFRV